jgi:hypothetical protein
MYSYVIIGVFKVKISIRNHIVNECEENDSFLTEN